jgi:hypothetical protein
LSDDKNVAKKKGPGGRPKLNRIEIKTTLAAPTHRFLVEKRKARGMPIGNIIDRLVEMCRHKF